MIKAGIVGGAGYTAGELIRLLINHPDVEIKFINTKVCTEKPTWYLPTNFLWKASTYCFSVRHMETQKNSWKVMRFRKT